MASAATSLDQRVRGDAAAPRLLRARTASPESTRPLALRARGAEIEALTREVARRLAGAMDTLVPRIAGRILEQVPELAPLDVDEPWASAAASVRANVETILALVPEGMRLDTVEPPPVTRERVRRLVREGGDVDVILRAYRWGHAELWAAWQEEVCAVPMGDATRSALLVHSSGLLFAYIDRVSALVAEDYARERRAWSRSPAALRAEVVRELLAGTCTDPHVASSRLGYELGVRHVALIVWRDDAHEGPAEPALERAAGTVARHLGARTPLLVPLNGSVLLAWCGCYASFDDEALAGLPQLQLERGIRVAVGDPGRGVPGFVRSHREAVATRELMRRRGGRSCQRYRDIALASLLVADRERAAEYMRTVLGPLADDSDGARRLRATLTILLEEGGSHTKTAARLNVHKNTVANRVARIEALLDRSVDRRCHNLEAALLIAQTLREPPASHEEPGRDVVAALTRA